jgi:S-DNA-T family DNA segregation ATPase FtsK/SpoIIIE
MSNLQPRGSNVIDIFPATKDNHFIEFFRCHKIGIESIDVKSIDNFEVLSIRLLPGTKISKIEKSLPELGLYVRSLSPPRGRLVMEEGIYEVTIQTARPEDFSVNYGDLKDNNNYLCPINLGRDEYGVEIVTDLNSMPNLLVAGTTGSGKSMLLHSIILSAISNGSDLYLIDPKGVEFDIYRQFNCVKSFASSIEDSRSLLQELYFIMEQTFSTLQKSGSRNVVDHNLISRNKIKPIVVVIDEWADLVMQDRKIQNELCLLAQKGRAAGISIILATQRPSATIISGPIKANFPARIAMRVASAVDSRVILDSSGAEKLAKAGSGIYLDPKTGSLRFFFAPRITSIQSELGKMNTNRKKTFWSMIWG